MSTRVYRIGGRPPKAGADLVRQDLALGRLYQNDLTGIERRYRRIVDDLNDVMGAEKAHKDYRVAVQGVIAARTAAKEHRAATGKRALTPAIVTAIASAVLAAKTAQRAFAAALATVRALPEYQATIAEIRKLRKDVDHETRAASGASWGTRQLADLAVAQAAAMKHFYYGPEVGLPKFSPFDGSGNVGVQLQLGRSVGTLFGCGDTQVRLQETTDPSRRANPTSKRAQRRRHIDLWMRLGSDEHRKPVWSVFPALLHRPFPPNCAVKKVAVHLRKRGPREEWFATFTLDLPADHLPDDAQHRPYGTGMVAINFGWRRMRDGWRIATCLESGSNTTTHFVLSNQDYSSLRYDDKLKSNRGDNFVVALPAARALLARLPVALPPAVIDEVKDVRGSLERLVAIATEWCLENGVTVDPDDLILGMVHEKAKTIAHWKSISKLAGLVGSWCRLTGVTVHHADYLAWTPPPVTSWTLRDLAIWRYHDHHLWEWEASQRTKARRHRKDLYRVFAAKLARQYGTLLIDTFEIKDVASKPEIEDDEDDIQQARTNRHAVSPSEMRNVIREAFVARNGIIEVVGSEYNTLRCHLCGHLDKWKPATELVHQCSKCKAIWDQDDNNTHNLYHRRAAAVAAGIPLIPVKKPARTWAKRRKVL